ncbi:MAG: hypothetical protein AAF383_01040 [Cyanobacteria bacterium P01_A01_bin.83]
MSWAARGSVQVASSDALGDSALRFRSWIECSYRDIKSDGWQWHQTRLRQPNRAERHWLVQSLRLRSSSQHVRADRRKTTGDFFKVAHDWGSFASRSVAMLWMVTLSGKQEISDDEPIIGDRCCHLMASWCWRSNW